MRCRFESRVFCCQFMCDLRDRKRSIEKATYRKAAIATVKKLSQVMCGPTHDFAYDLLEYRDYLIRTYNITEENTK